MAAAEGGQREEGALTKLRSGLQNVAAETQLDLSGCP